MRHEEQQKTLIVKVGIDSMSFISRFQSIEKNIPYVYLDWYDLLVIYTIDLLKFIQLGLIIFYLNIVKGSEFYVVFITAIR